MKISYSVQAKSIPNVDIKAGFFLAGNTVIFNATGSINIQVDFAAKIIKGYISSSPINLGNFFSLSGNGTDLGPYINFNAALMPPTLIFQMSAVITIFFLLNLRK